MSASLPVLLYHYISYLEDSISVPPDLFEEHLKALSDNGWKGIGLSDAQEFLEQGRPIPPKSVLITFDDGFLDNYVYAYPLLKKYGHKGVIFTVAGKIEAEGPLRPTLEDVWSGLVKTEELPRVDEPFRISKLGRREKHDLFFNWNEARVMEESGVLSIAPHTMHHRSVFLNSSWKELIVPELRTRTFDRIEGPVLFGMPRFPVGPAMTNRAFLPSRELIDTVTETVPQELRAARTFLTDPEKTAELRDALKTIPRESLGSIESQEVYTERVLNELVRSREIVEAELGHAVTAMAWPWGASSPESLALGREAGFSTFFTTAVGPNLPGRKPEAVCRFKSKVRPASWLLSRVKIYSRPIAARVYSGLRM